jgi:NAD+ diphosphatase
MWISREDVKRSLAGDPNAPMIAPPHYAIAHTLLTAWAEEQP